MLDLILPMNKTLKKDFKKSIPESLCLRLELFVLVSRFEHHQEWLRVQAVLILALSLNHFAVDQTSTECRI